MISEPRKILEYPASADVLRTPCRTVDLGTDLHVLDWAIPQMIALMQTEGRNGVGLAANQVGIRLRFFVAYVPDEMTSPRVYINPVLKLSSHLPKLVDTEGCLSCPGVLKKIARQIEVSMTCIDIEGRPCVDHSTGLLARVWQHEVDHLDGILIMDYK